MKPELQEGEAFCARCRQTKPKDQFYNRKEGGRPLSYCVSCQTEVKELRFRENMERLIESREGTCADCGLPYPAPIYEFYSETGLFNISKLRHMSYSKIIEILQSYLMLCRNCCALRMWEAGKI